MTGDASRETTPAASPSPPTPTGWSRVSRDVAIVLWPSFLAAAIETMFFFAIFDPVDLGEGTALADLVANHNAGYAIGFFFFWAFTTLSGALSLYLTRTETAASGSHTSSRP
ncbi:MAG: hypothetical protein NTZ79_01225 [Proteobacteria bacterium]|nr:hypothetical protein [Pseudomonadota bacterium]